MTIKPLILLFLQQTFLYSYKISLLKSPYIFILIDYSLLNESSRSVFITPYLSCCHYFRIINELDSLPEYYKITWQYKNYTIFFKT